MATTSYVDDTITSLATKHTSGSGSLVMASGYGATLAARLTAVGYPAVSTAHPLRVVVMAWQSQGVVSSTYPKVVYLATGLTADTLTGCTANEGTTDKDWDPGDVLLIALTAGLVKELQDAIAVGGTGLPSQSGHASEVLTTDGSTASWAVALPIGTFTDADGEVLTYDGTASAWLGKVLTPGANITITTTTDTITIAATGGSGLPSGGSADQLPGRAHDNSGLEWKTITAGSGITVTGAAGTITIAATGGGGGMAIGGAVTGSTAGQVLYTGAGGLLASSATLAYDGYTLGLTPAAGVASQVWYNPTGTIVALMSSAGNLAIGSTTAQPQRFSVIDTANSEPSCYASKSNAGLYSDTGWTNYYGAFELANRDQTDGNVAYLSFSGHPTGGFSTAAVGCVTTDHTNHYGDLFFVARGADGFNVRLYVAGSGVVTIPGSLVVGSLPVRVKPLGTPSVVSSTITFDCTSHDDFAAVTLGAASPYTLTFTNLGSSPRTIVFALKQDSTGGRTVGTWPAPILSPGGAAGRALSTAASVEDLFVLRWDGTTYRVTSAGQGYA